MNRPARAFPSHPRRRPAIATAVRPDLQLLLPSGDRNHGANHRFRAAVAMFVRLLTVGIALVILTMWVRGGNLTAVHSPGAALTSAGRLTGLLGSYLLLIQLLLLARMPWLEWVASFDRLAVWHRINGRMCITLILAHVGLITAGYALTDRLTVVGEFTALVTQYPGMIQATIGTVLLVLVIGTSVAIVRRQLRYETWFFVHLLAYAAVFLGWFHQIPTGNELVASPLAAAFWTALYIATLQLIVLFRVLQPLVRAVWHDLRVTEVVEEGAGVVSLRIAGRHLNWMDAHAGQFFLWRFLDGARWRESHPFSLSAAPDGRSLRITVKDLGDFSRGLATIKPGTRVLAEGPFGRFTAAARTRPDAALIAGGIGITPIRALLEEMGGRLALIYRVVREDEAIFRHELEQLARERGIELHLVTGDHRAPGNEHLMTAGHLRDMVPDLDQREVYLCGPAAMMRATERAVRRAGVPKQAIHTDRFAF